MRDSIIATLLAREISSNVVTEALRAGEALTKVEGPVSIVKVDSRSSRLKGESWLVSFHTDVEPAAVTTLFQKNGFNRFEGLTTLGGARNADGGGGGGGGGPPADGCGGGGGGGGGGNKLEDGFMVTSED